MASCRKHISGWIFTKKKTLIAKFDLLFIYHTSINLVLKTSHKDDLLTHFRMDWNTTKMGARITFKQGIWVSINTSKRNWSDIQKNKSDFSNQKYSRNPWVTWYQRKIVSISGNQRSWECCLTRQFFQKMKGYVQNC